MRHFRRVARLTETTEQHLLREALAHLYPVAWLPPPISMRPAKRNRSTRADTGAHLKSRFQGSSHLRRRMLTVLSPDDLVNVRQGSRRSSRENRRKVGRFSRSMTSAASE